MQTITGRIEVYEEFVRVELGLPALLHLVAKRIIGQIESRGAALLEGPKGKGVRIFTALRESVLGFSASARRVVALPRGNGCGLARMRRPAAQIQHLERRRDAAVGFGEALGIDQRRRVPMSRGA